MPKVKKTKTQLEKFKKAAREVAADEDEKAFDDKLRRAVLAERAHKSDCAMHNAPAMRPGLCTCGAIKGGR